MLRTMAADSANIVLIDIFLSWSVRGRSLLCFPPKHRPPAIIPSIVSYRARRRPCCADRLTSGSGGPPGERNGQSRHGERTKAAIAERQKLSALLKMLRPGLR